MGMGPIILTCLAWSLHQSPAQPYHMNTRAVGLPPKFNSQEHKDIEALVLLYSTDRGETWEQLASKPANDPKQFEFHAPRDGEYWFLIQLVDRAKVCHPRNPYRMKPTMAVVVDTVPPQVKVTAERLPNGEIRTHWTASDQYPDVRSIRMDYHTSGQADNQWTPLGINSLEGEHKFPVGGDLAGQIQVRVQMRDQAGNVGQDVAVVSGTAASFSPSGSVERSPIGLIPTTRNDPPSQPNQLTSQQTSRPVLEPPPGPGMMMAPQPPPAPSAPAPAPSAIGGMPIAANPERANLGAPAPPEASANAPTVKIVKAREVRLDFTVGKIGPSGLGNAANVYVTLDSGKNWQKMPGDVPISVAPGGAGRDAESVTGSVSVHLPKEGIVYGFIVAAKSKAGLAPPPPKPGDPPEVLVELDATEPKGELLNPLPDPSQPNTLMMGWRANDRNFGEKPITLEWAEQKDGPWNPIGDGPLPNNGQFAWRLPERLPPRVFLRLTMRDQAGNESRAQTDRPQLIDLSVPQTKITGIAPASR